jgi:bifunctional UDP-N-acetylglucosamine pyrophosphorylase/glucosamine-1-phosphate N-acetyltransferase/UDP-N-acetylglucosamine pyrophosphorylase
MDSIHHAVIILAAGLGKRMRSTKPKVLHELQRQPMIYYIIHAAQKLASNNIYVVVGYQADLVRIEILKFATVNFILQENQLGTGHAVQCVLPALSADISQVIILCGDTPLIRYDTLNHLLSTHVSSQSDVTVLVTRVDNPKGYGRIIFNEKNELAGIVEEADADPEQKKINIVNTGIYAVKRSVLARLLQKIDQNNVQKEFYLTDIIRYGRSEKLSIGTVMGKDPIEIIGINSIEDLQNIERLLHQRKIKLLDFDSHQQL